MEKHFTHLHVHTDYSLLDGAIKLDKLVNFGKENNFKALAITDHGNIFGAVKFFQKCQKSNIKPILGIESYFTEDASQKSAENKYYHLIILVQNAIGYKNLCKLISYSFKEGFYFKPRIDYRMLEQHNEGLIVTSACLGGHIPKLLMNNNEAEAEQRMDWFLRVFGPERFYLEVQPEDQPEQAVLNKKLFELSSRKGVQCVATADCHYTNADDRQAHEVMLSIQTHHKITDPDRFSFGNCRVHLRTTQQMLEIFPEHPEAIWNAGKIADSCEFEFETGKLFFPAFPIPKEHTQESYFTQLCKNGMQQLIDAGLTQPDKEQKYWDRLKLEMDLLISMGFVGYFLVVSDFIQWAKRANIPVGPGRGSAAGSLASWALQITNVDPLKYNLLFERFLNPERVSMPDIDIDFCIEGRDRVIDYVRDRYGHDKVCQIITFGTMMAKGVIKDVARVLGIPFEDSNMITGLIPDQLKITLKEAIEAEPRLQELIDNNPRVKEVFDLAFRLEGLTRHASKHAAGIVISPKPIDEVLPVYVPAKSTELVTQYAMTELEALGYLKIDFLGLKNLTLVDRAVALIKHHHNVELDMDRLPLDDVKVFELLCAGKTAGVFQLESSGLQEILRKLQPDKFEDIIAVNALYRPGPLGSGMVEDFIERRHGRQKVSYLFDELEPILCETYGVIVYQEQVMHVASRIAGYSLGQADILRRAMGKKKVEVMAEQRKLFLAGAQERSFDAKKAGELFDLMAYFAGYGFNKSHSTAYALIAYQTAYLKANYPAEFMAALISLETDHAEKMTFYLNEAREMGLGILPPTINTSQVLFSVVDGKLLFGLRGIKNVGLTALETILTERTKEPFQDLLDLCMRVDLRTVNKRVLENLICAGAFDCLPGNRAQQHEELNAIINQAVAAKRAKETGQMDLFGNAVPGKKNEKQIYAFQPLEDWDNKEKLEKEKEVAGFYLSAHPLDSYRQQLRWINPSSFEELRVRAQAANPSSEPIVVACGSLKNYRVITTKKGDRMAFAQMEDRHSQAEVVLFPRLFKRVERWLDEHHVFVVKGALDAMSQHKCKIKANEFVPIELFFDEWKSLTGVRFTLPSEFGADLLETIGRSCPRGNLLVSITLQENGKKVRIASSRRVSISGETLTELEEQNVRVRMKT